MSDSDGSKDDFFLSSDNDQNEDETLLESDEEEESQSEALSSDAEVDEDKPTGKVLGEIKPLSEEAIKAFNDKINRTGVVYLSSIPPYMTFQKIIYLLSKYGKINRSHIVGDEKSEAYHRKHPDSHRRQRFVEGWVEFEDKRDAKTCVAQLNGRIVGGKKKSEFHDCMWTMKYLHGFKWPQLLEMLNYEKRLRMDKLKAEFTHSRKQDEKFLENVNKSNKHKMIEKRKKEKEEKEKEEKKN